MSMFAEKPHFETAEAADADHPAQDNGRGWCTRCDRAASVSGRDHL